MGEPSTIGWGVMVCGHRSSWLYYSTKRTRKEAREDFITWWRDEEQALQALRSGRYKIVKVRITLAGAP
jgi:hypothetical protein